MLKHFQNIMLVFLLSLANSAEAQMHGHGMNDGGPMDEYCPMCGHYWNGGYQDRMFIPQKFPELKNKEWLEDLQNVLSLEKQSKLQYEADSEKFQIRRPYMMVIPQENYHINWISDLLKAYDASTDVQVPEVRSSESLEKAYERAMDLESDLMEKYEKLIQTAENERVREILSLILFQTRMHYTMFKHASSMNKIMHWWWMKDQR